MDGSLYERLGGTDAITAVVRAIVDRQMKDDRIDRKFARTNVDRVIKEFVDLFCQATGGPCVYTGRDMTEAHHDMSVTNGEFQAFVEDVVAVLDDFKVGKAEQEELLNILAPLQGEIVEVDSGQVGTPLPSAFIPAPPLLATMRHRVRAYLPVRVARSACLPKPRVPFGLALRGRVPRGPPGWHSIRPRKARRVGFDGLRLTHASQRTAVGLLRDN
ncbi:MAG TPA: group 1 truncated hemoglobin [Streptosporangiaceae bacterium]|nr:group 1 truncated hemoglobin [Streptosporangiaceae bacterium]